MSTAQNIVRRALRLCGVLAAGKEPTGAQAQDGLERLQSAVLDLPGLVKRGRWREVTVSADYTARESDRCTIVATATVSLPVTIACDGRTRPPRDMARVQIVGAGVWIYSATKGSWGRAEASTLAGDMPFGPEDDDGLAALLAVNLIDEYGAELTDRTVQLAKECILSLRARFMKAQPIDWTRPEPLGPLTVPGSPFWDYD